MVFVVVIWLVVVDEVYKGCKCCLIKFVMCGIYSGVYEGYCYSFSGKSELMKFFYLCFFECPVVCCWGDEWEYV